MIFFVVVFLSYFSLFSVFTLCKCKDINGTTHHYTKRQVTRNDEYEYEICAYREKNTSELIKKVAYVRIRSGRIKEIEQEIRRKDGVTEVKNDAYAPLDSKCRKRLQGLIATIISPVMFVSIIAFSIAISLCVGLIVESIYSERANLDEEDSERGNKVSITRILIIAILSCPFSCLYIVLSVVTVPATIIACIIYCLGVIVYTFVDQVLNHNNKG
jgi:hypothetical protein